MINQTPIDTSNYQHWTHRSLARTLREAYRKQVETGQRESVLILGYIHAGKTDAVHSFCDAIVDELKLTDARGVPGCDYRYIQAHLRDERSVATENSGWDKCFFVWEWEPQRSFSFLADCSKPHGVVLVDWSSLDSEGRSQVAQSLRDLEAQLPPQVLVVATLLSPERPDRAETYYQADGWPSLRFDEREWKSFEACFQIRGILQLDPQEWLEDYALEKNIHPDILEFINTDSEKLLGLTLTNEERQRMISFPSPVKIEALSPVYRKLINDFRKLHGSGQWPHGVRVEFFEKAGFMASARCGVDWGNKFVSFLWRNEMPKALE